MQRNFLRIILLSISMFLFLISLLISPYKDELDLAVKQINENGLLVLRLIFIFIMIITLFYFYLKDSKRMIFYSVSMLILGLYAFIKLGLSFVF